MMTSPVLLVLQLALADSSAFIRVNQLGYRPEDPKVAVVCALRDITVDSFAVVDDAGRAMFSHSGARATSWPRSPRRLSCIAA